MSKAKEEVVKIPSFAYQNINGALGIVGNGTIDWLRCRDQFQAKTEARPVDSFLFYHAAGTRDRVINFIRTVESAANCPKDMVLTFKPTSHKEVLWVGLTAWWKHRVRRSLLTALLRCGQNFDQDNAVGFKKALDSQYYVSGTKLAMEAFLAGRSAVKLAKTMPFTGWHAFFAGKNRNQVEECLVKLKRKKRLKKVVEEVVEG